MQVRSFDNLLPVESREANVGQDAGVVDTNDKDAFIAAAKTRQWDREKSVRALGAKARFVPRGFDQENK